MTFEEIVDRAIAMLQRRQRVAYRTLKAQFDLDDDALEALKDELLYAQQVARDEDGRVLVWCGSPEVTRAPIPATSPREPRGTLQDASGEPDAPSSIERRAPEAERRQLTVLFCDLVESTPLAGRLDPEDLREVVRAYQATCAEVIQRFDGRVAQYLGDGLLVYFGYPQAHEDDAQRAIRAGREIIEAVGILNTGLEHEKGVRLAVRAGIHTGLVVVGEIGTRDRQEQLALGETPNIAARLQGLALPDTVVISDATWRLVQGYFIGHDLGVHHLRGVATAVSLYQILGESGAQSRLDVGRARGLTPLVGRESEVTMLLERWGQAKDGLGQVVMLTGEAGIGKSRLVQVLKERLGGESYAAWECRCSPYHQHSALYPVVDLLHRTFHWHPDDTPDDKREKLEQGLRQYRLPLADTVPLLASLLSLPFAGGRYAPLDLTPQRQKHKTMETIRALVLELAERQPVLVIVEDLHWVDPSTLEFLSLLVDQGPSARLLILLTCRPEFQSPWGSRAYLTPLVLHRLPRSQVEVMVERVAGGKPLPPEVTHQIVTRTDGVPLFVEELIKTILESGWLQERADHYALTGHVPPVVIPATLHDALMARLDRLSTAKMVAQLGATIGRTFAYDLLRTVAPLDEATLQRDLRRLIDAELLYARGVPPQATYTFKHALIQEAAYQSLLKRTRQQYHQRIAQVLETRFGDMAATQPELLAHHLTEAGLIGQAIGYWQWAGQRAIERSAHLEAISHLTKGLAALKAVPDGTERARQELRLLSILGLAQVATKGQGHQDVARTYVRARELCLQIGETPQLFLAGLLSVYVVRAELQAAWEVAQQLLSLAQRQHDTAILVAAQWALGHSLFLRGDLGPGRAHLERGIALSDSQQPHARGFPSGFPGDLGVFSRCFAAHALWHLGYPDQSLERMHEALALAQKLAHPYSRALALDYAAMLYQFRRDATMVRESAEAAMTLCKEQGFAYYLSWATIMQGWALAALGQCEAGMAHMHDGLAAMRATGAALRQPYYLALLAEVCGRMDRAAAGLALLGEALAEADKTGEHWTVADLHRRKGELLLHSSVGGSEAEQCFHQALAIARRQQARSLELRGAVSLARLWQGQGKHADARELLTPIFGWFTEGFDTADLQEAAVLLKTLGSRV
jgi:class 3 adenylate cyclase/predicted ATPase